jgi:ATP-binding cassette, subfamily B, bacterial MsbA
MILDEATSALATESERLVQEALVRRKHGCTTLIVAYRFSTIRHAPRVVVLHRGKIAEQGTRRNCWRGKAGFTGWRSCKRRPAVRRLDKFAVLEPR